MCVCVLASVISSPIRGCLARGVFSRIDKRRDLSNVQLSPGNLSISIRREFFATLSACQSNSLSERECGKREDAPSSYVVNLLWLPINEHQPRCNDGY